jgi:hypothetical protein
MPSSNTANWNKLKHKFGSFLRNQDVFGHQMQLNFGGEDTFKTTFGGLMTVMSRLAIVIFLIF